MLTQGGHYSGPGGVIVEKVGGSLSRKLQYEPKKGHLVGAMCLSVQYHFGMVDSEAHVYRRICVYLYEWHIQFNPVSYMCSSDSCTPFSYTCMLSTQAHVFQVLEYVMIELNYVPSSELASIGLLLQKKE